MPIKIEVEFCCELGESDVTNVVILSAVRTAIGDFGGGLASVPPCELGAIVAAEAIVRAGVSANQIEQTVIGNVLTTCPEDMYVSRVVAMRAGVPASAPALTLNRLCGSGLQAVISGAEQIILGNAQVVLAGGVESMSRSGHLLTQSRRGTKMGDVIATDMMVGVLTDPFGHGHMGITAENIAEQYGISRAAQDAFAAESHRRAAQALAEGRMAGQIVPVTVKERGRDILIQTDEHVRADVTAAGLSSLRPAFRKDGTVTAGNASSINDGAAAVVLMAADAARAQGLTPLARIVAYGLGGVAPDVMGLGPIPASEQALLRAGLTASDLDVIESNEAFAAQACAVTSALGLDPAKVNPNGGAVAFGHPLGASGAIILTKLIHELRRVKGRYGLATMCIGGGQGIALIIEAQA